MHEREKTDRILTAFDMFSGCGGLTEGLKAASFKVIGAVELDDFAAKNYVLNHPEVKLWRADVKRLSVAEVCKELALRRGQLDLLAGCPPCQGFSTLRTRNGSTSGRDQRNTLLKEFSRFVEGLLPKAIMLENVPGLAEYRLFQPFCRNLERLGYLGSHTVLNASDYSVPQRRKRLIYVAGFGHYIEFAAPHPKFVTVRTAIASLPPAGISGDPIHDLPETRSKIVMARIRQVPKNGGSRTGFSKDAELQCHKVSNGFKDVYGRMAWEAVSPTITGGCFNPSKGRFIHPEQDRAITMREAAILQGFPRNYKFSAERGKVALAQMIGNALPPPFIKANADIIRTTILKRVVGTKDTLIRQQRSKNMAAVKGRDTKPELAVRSMLHNEGYRFRLHRKDLQGRPDIVLPSRRIAIFVNGCFWHSHSCKRGQSTPSINGIFWAGKRATTVARDADNYTALATLGWIVIVLWECEIKTSSYRAPLLRCLASLQNIKGAGIDILVA